MQIRHVIAMILAVVLVLVLVNLGPHMATALTDIGRTGPRHAADEKFVGLMALGLIGAVLVAIVKILNNRNEK